MTLSCVDLKEDRTWFRGGVAGRRSGASPGRRAGLCAGLGGARRGQAGLSGAIRRRMGSIPLGQIQLAPCPAPPSFSALFSFHIRLGPARPLAAGEDARRRSSSLQWPPGPAWAAGLSKILANSEESKRDLRRAAPRRASPSPPPPLWTIAFINLERKWWMG